jgi:hypothetical protein
MINPRINPMINLGWQTAEDRSQDKSNNEFRRQKTHDKSQDNSNDEFSKAKNRG